MNGGAVAPHRIRRASDAIMHRGPDDEGFLSWRRGTPLCPVETAAALEPGEVLLAHRRLSIQDLSRSGCQPFLSADSDAAIVYNGEIYNFVELRDDLQRFGAQFRSNTDTEVLLQSWLRTGPECLKHLTGMFAFCLLDTKQEKAFLVRDFFGIKPLYYTVQDQTLHFASEIRALLELSGLRPRLNLPRAIDYLVEARTDHGEETMLEDIHRVLPGEMIEIPVGRPGEIRRSRYWTLPSPQVGDYTRAEASAELRKRFLRSVDLHLRSDARVGAALSGGIDSSAIIAAIRHLRGDQIDIHAYSYIADDPQISEEKWVDIAGAHARAIVHKVRPTPQEFAADLDAHILSNNEPVGNFNGYLQRRVYASMRRDGIKVSLDGQGADELFAGYDHFYTSALVGILLAGDIRTAHSFNKRLTDLGFSSGLGNLLRGVAKLRLPDALVAYLTKSPSKPAWLSATIKIEHRRSTSTDLFDALQSSVYIGLQRLLRCQDLNSMASSIESRVPFLTPDIAELAFSVPADFHIDGAGVRKALVRSAMRGIAAESTLARMDKQGAPTVNWLRLHPQLVREALCESRHPVLSLFNSDSLNLLMDRFLNGDDSASTTTWRIVNLIRWCELLGVDVPPGPRPQVLKRAALIENETAILA